MNPVAALHRAHRWFWILATVAIMLVGALSYELQAHASALTGLAVAVTGSLLALVVTQACRLMLAIGRAAPARTGFRKRPQGSPRLKGPRPVRR